MKAYMMFVGASLAAGNVNIPTMEIASGVYMPIVSIGTGGTERDAAKAIVENWLGLGGRGIDTAWMYKDQDVVRDAIREMHAPRDSLFITTKISGCPGASASQYIEDDLRLLGVEYIDLLLIHYPSPAGPACAATWTVFEEYHAKGVVRAIGVSNFKEQDLESLLQTATVVPAVNQIQLNVLVHDDATIAFCAAHSIVVEAYSPLGRGGHSGDIPDNKVVQGIAASHNVTTYQVAMRWIVQHGWVVTFQSAAAAHQEVDADLFGFNLTAQEMALLDSLQAEEQQGAARLQVVV